MSKSLQPVDLGSTWCILRTSGGRTLPLANSLATASFDVWTPRQTVKWRRPRSNVTLDRDQPIMPTFVFARAVRLSDLHRVLAMPVNPHPPFSIFHYAGRIPLIADASIENLRAIEEKARAVAERLAKDEARKLARKGTHYVPIGASVRVAEESAFVGVAGVVEACDGKSAWVRFGRQRIQIDAWTLLPDSVSGALEPA